MYFFAAGLWLILLLARCTPKNPDLKQNSFNPRCTNLGVACFSDTFYILNEKLAINPVNV